MPIKSDADALSFSSGRLNHIPFLDAVRGFAVLSVFFFHSLGAAYGWDVVGAWNGMYKNFNQPPGLLFLFPFTLGGSLGVATFFVVSGFCIHLSHGQSKDASWSSFFLRRFFRIYPAYLLCLLVFFFLWPWYHYSLESPSARISLISHLFSVHHLIYDAKYTINPSFWSIGAEVQLYAVYPLLILLTAKVGWRRSLFLLFGIEVVIRLLGFYVPAKSIPFYWISNSPLSFWFSWSIGAYLAECRLKNRHGVLTFIPIPIVVFLAIVIPQYRPTSSLDFPLFALLAALIIDRMLSSSWRDQNPTGFGIWRSALWDQLSFIGVVSYGFYLIHQPIVDAIKASLVFLLKRPFGSELIFLTCILSYPLIIFASWALYRLVEKPFISIGRRFIGLTSSQRFRLQ